MRDNNRWVNWLINSFNDDSVDYIVRNPTLLEVEEEMEKSDRSYKDAKRVLIERFKADVSRNEEKNVG
jgi:hypothetical protein